MHVKSFFQLPPHLLPHLALVRPRTRALPHAFRIHRSHRPSKDECAFRPIAAPLLLYFAAIAVVLIAPRFTIPTSPGKYGPLIAILALTLLFCAWVGHLTREQSRCSIRKFLLAKGIPLCQHCGYDLSDLRVDPSIPSPCPECGQPIASDAIAILRGLEEA